MRQIVRDTLQEFQFVSNPRISPDGRYVAYILQQADMERDGYSGELYLNDGTGSHPLTKRGDVTNCCWCGRETLVFSQPCQLGQEGRPGTAFFHVRLDGTCEKAFELPIAGAGVVAVEGDIYLLRGNWNLNMPDTAGMEADQAKVAMEAWRNPPYTVFDEVPFWWDGRGIINGIRSGAFLYDAGKGTLERITGETYQVDHLAMKNGKVVYSGYDQADGISKIDYEVCLYDMAAGHIKLCCPARESISAIWICGRGRW